MAFLVLPVLAALAVNGSFSDVGASGLPRGWVLHTYCGYQPLARVETVEDAALGLPSVRLTEITAKQGTCLRSTARHAAKAGDRFLVSFLARGSGRLTPGLYCYGPKGEWLAPVGTTPQAVSDRWRLLEFEISVPADRPKPVTSVEFVVDGTRGGTFAIADFRVERMDAPPDMPREREVETVLTVAREDYEGKSACVGSPRIVQTDIAPGLLKKTNIGTYRTRTSATVALAPCRISVPSATNEAASASFRLYAFSGGTLREAFAGPAGKFSLRLAQRAVPELVEGELADGTNVVLRFKMPMSSLPADFRVDFNSRGSWGLDVTSLSDSSVRRFVGRAEAFVGTTEVASALRLTADGGGEAQMALDEYSLCTVRVKARSVAMPFSIERLATFDPEKAGWPLVFEDEFEGTALDTNKWYFPHYAGRHRDFVALDGKGHLRVKADLDKDGKLVTDGIWSTRAQRYGYFEARLKFTYAPGWWAAFWLYGPTDTNPFLDGFEIDVFEDYYTRGKGGKAGPRQGVLDHNLHVSAPGTLKSWNYNSRLPRGLDDWYILGCRWTPFEISYYLDGKLIKTKASHSPYDTLTFDAFRHAAGLAPLHAIVSGQIHGDWTNRVDRSRLPDFFEVDRVRIYAYPEPPDEMPRICWTRGRDDMAMTPEGSMLDFSVEAKSATGTRQPVTGVYLFDNGFPVGCRIKPPYDFLVRFSEAAYRNNAYMRPGRSGAAPKFDANPHVFVAFAQDASGRVAHTTPVWRFPVTLRSVPYEGQPQSVPGTVLAARFDSGGRGVSSFTAKGRNDHWDPQRKGDGVMVGRSGWVGHIYAGDWLNYTVDVAAAGAYEVCTLASFQVRGVVGVSLFCDGRPLGRLSLDGCKYWKKETSEAGALRVMLPAGRHVLTVAAEGGIVFKSLEIRVAGK